MNSLTRQQLERRKAQAVRFTRDVREDDDRADEIEDESLEDYAHDRQIRLSNPKGARNMAVQTRRELLERIQELEAENEGLQSRLPEGKQPWVAPPARQGTNTWFDVIRLHGAIKKTVEGAILREYEVATQPGGQT